MEHPILNGLIAYNVEGTYPWHMPGHKRRLQTIFPSVAESPFAIDVTEVGDLDNLHSPEGIIKDSMVQASQIYGADRSYYLVNGSTAGILAAISSLCKTGEQIVVARNCHKSVYQAIRILHLKPIYVMPEWNEQLGMFGGISPEKIKDVIRCNDAIKAVIVVSPTYEGVVSDIEKIAKIVHRENIPLIVDEAHGAHLEFVSNVNETISTANYQKIPNPAIRLGADLVIESLHKTLPAMTQCSILHAKGDLVSYDRLEEFLSIYQSSSPSYVFMASIEACIEKMDHERDGLFILYKQTLIEYRKKFEKLQHIHLVNEYDFKSYHGYGYDAGKLVFSVKDCGIKQQSGVIPMNGVILGDMLEKEYGQMMEMAGANYVIAMTTIADTKEAFEGLYHAIMSIDAQLIDLSSFSDIKGRVQINYATLPEIKMDISDAKDCAMVQKKVESAVGDISAEYIYVYPPGIPIVAPGEVLTAEIIEDVLLAMKKGFHVKGLQDSDLAQVTCSVVKEEI